MLENMIFGEKEILWTYFFYEKSGLDKKECNGFGGLGEGRELGFWEVGMEG